MPLLILVMILLASGSLQADPKVALFSNDPQLEDLLVAKLGEGVQILSRSDLSSIASEGNLTGVSLELKGANVAMILQRVSEQELSVRIVDASSGATVAELRPPAMPLPQVADWIALRSPTYLTAVADATAPRISLIGLRFELDSPENRTLERGANLRLSAALQNGGAVVLERWRLRDLIFEKVLLNDDSPFWKEATLLDGSLSNDHGLFSARLRLRGKVEKTFTANAETLDKLIDDLAQKVTQGWPRGSLESADSEPAAYRAEAEWMIQHGLPREAWQAAEAALALGLAGGEMEVLRMKAAAMTAYPDDLRSTHGQDGGYRKKAFPIEELPERVAAATEMMSMVSDYCDRHGQDKPLPGWNLQNAPTLGVHTLYTGLRVLRTAHDAGWFREHGAEVAALRQAVGKNIQWLKSINLGQYLSSVFCTYLTNYAGYWNESPVDAIEYYRKVLKPDFDRGRTLRAELAYSDEPHPPLLVGEATQREFPFGLGSWRVIDWQGDRAKELWAAFLDELASSPDPLSQADALALRWQSTGDLQARLALTEKMVDFCAAHVDAILGPNGRSIFAEFTGPFRQCKRNEMAPVQEKLVHFFIDLLKAPRPIPKETLSKIWVIFFDQSSKTKKPELASLLLAALAEREKQFPGMHDEADLREARASIVRDFPELRVDEPGPDTVDVTSFWITSEHFPKGGEVYFDHGAATWYRGALWASIRGGLWRIDPVTGETAIVNPDIHYGHLKIWGNRFVVAGNAGVWVLDEKLTTWTKIELPPAHYAIGVSDNSLWATSGKHRRAGQEADSNGTSLFRVAPDLSTHLVASSRRRPVAHPMDETIQGDPLGLFPAKEGVIFGALAENWIFLTSKDGQPVPPLNHHRRAGILKVSNHPEILVRCESSGGPTRLVTVERLSTTGVELLLARPPTSGKKREGEPPRFPYPEQLEQLSAREHVVEWDGKTLTILSWSAEGSPWGASQAWIFRISERGTLFHPLRFVWPEDGEERAKKAHFESRTFRFPHPDPGDLIATDKGLVIAGRALHGFWFLPYSAVDAP